MPDIKSIPSVSNPASKPDNVLQFAIDNRERYLPENVEGALAELQNRGVTFSDEELKVIGEDMQARRELAAANNTNWGFFGVANKNNIIDDPDAYSFYSKQVIRVFAILFSTFFGSIMLAVNISKTKNTSGVIYAIMFGLFFTTAQVVIGNSAKLGTSFTFIFGLIGATCLDYFFWNRYIGNSTLYRTRSYWVPSIIALAIVSLLLAAMFLGNAAVNVR